MRKIEILLTLIAVMSQSIPSYCQELNRDPDKARLVTLDIPNFWQAYDQADKKTGAERIRIFDEQYLAKGSVGLKDFVRERISSAQQLVEAIDTSPNYYRSIRASTLRVSTMEPQIRQCFVKLRELYPEAVFPDVYFVIGRMNSGGTTSDNGLLIGAEISARAFDSPLGELGDYLRLAVKPVEKISIMIAHELIHFQQHYKQGTEGSLLGHSIMEGSADFIGELISGGQINQHVYEYGYAHERELWEEFQQGMDGQDYSKWMYNGGNSKDRPGDLGYFIGYRICQAYYSQAVDKHQALYDILNLQDAHEFLRVSGYGEAASSKPPGLPESQTR